MPRYNYYEDTCYDTVFTLQDIPSKYGKCIDDTTGKVNPPCVCKSNLIFNIGIILFSLIFKMHWQE